MSIKQAAAATNIVIDGFNSAQAALRICFVNGAGVLSDPSTARRDLLEAKAAINDALAALDSIQVWPMDQAHEDA